MPVDTIQFAEPPEWRDGEIAILTPRPGRPIIAIATADCISGVETHWIGSRTVPCTRYSGQCPGCKAEPALPIRWKGFLPVYLKHSRTQALLQIAPSALRSLLQDAGGDLPPLRGKWIDARRKGSHANSSVSMKVSHEPLPSWLVLPEPCDVAMVLQRVFYS